MKRRLCLLVSLFKISAEASIKVSVRPLKEFWIFDQFDKNLLFNVPTKLLPLQWHPLQIHSDLSYLFKWIGPFYPLLKFPMHQIMCRSFITLHLSWKRCWLLAERVSI